MALFVVGGFISGETRVVLWLIGLGSILFGTIMAGSSDWIVRERIVVSAVIVVLVALGGSLNGVILLLLVDGLLLAVLVAEYMRIERPTPAPAESS